MLVTVLPRQLDRDAMSMPSHAGDGAAIGGRQDATIDCPGANVNRPSATGDRQGAAISYLGPVGDR
jgi:hypothetical protein